MRKCQKCGSSKYMTKVTDKECNITDERWRICFKCQPELEDILEDCLYIYMLEDEKKKVA